MRYDRWVRVTEWPLLGLAVVFLVAYAVSVIGDLHGRADDGAETVMNVVWAAFVLDYVVRLILVEARRRWFLRHLPELVLVAVPVFRPLRLLRLLSVVRVLHSGGVAALRGRVAVYIAATTALLVLIAGLAVLDAEQDAPGSNIRTIGDAWWWAFTTLSTVGYGDRFPMTPAGRAVAVALMACGVGLVASVSALLASWLLQEVQGAGPDGRCGTDPRHERSRNRGPETGARPCGAHAHPSRQGADEERISSSMTGRAGRIVRQEVLLKGQMVQTCSLAAGSTADQPTRRCSTAPS